MKGRSRFISVHASSKQEFLDTVKLLDEDSELNYRKRQRTHTYDDIHYQPELLKNNNELDNNDEYDGCLRSKNTNNKQFEDEYYSDYKGETLIQIETERKKSQRKRSSEDDFEYGYHKGQEFINNKIEHKNEQYFIDNDQCLGREYNYLSNMIKQKTEDEDMKELEDMITRINKIYKQKKDNTEDNLDNYTDILCRYFKVNIMLSTSEDSSYLKNTLIKLNDIHSFTSFKNNKENNKFQKSMSFNSVTDVNLYNLVDYIINTNKKKRQSRSSIVVIDNIESSTKSKSNVDNLKELIIDNVDVDDTVKILLIGDKEIKAKFFRALKYSDSNVNQNEVNSINDGIGILDIIKEKVSFYDKVLLLHFFSTNAAFFTNQLSKTYFHISHSIIILVDLDSPSSIDNFFFVFNKISEYSENEKISVIIWNSSQTSENSIDRKSIKSIKSNRYSLTQNIRSSVELLIKKPSSAITLSEGILNNNKNAKIKAFIKIYKIPMIQVSSFMDISMSNPSFLHFIGFQLLTKLKKYPQKSLKAKSIKYEPSKEKLYPRILNRTYSYK